MGKVVKMKKTNTKKTTKKSVNIFVILAILLVILIVIAVGAGIVDKASAHNLVNSYIEHQYGTKGNVKLTHNTGYNQYTGEPVDYWTDAEEKYTYNVLAKVLFDNERDTNASTAAQTAVDAMLAERGDSYVADTVQIIHYIDNKDVTEEKVDFIVNYITNTETAISSTDDAAQLIWDVMQSVEGYDSFNGVQVNVFNMEHEFNCYIDAFEGKEVTLELIKENTTATTEDGRSYLYSYWLTSESIKNAEVETEGEELEVDESNTEADAE